MNSVQQSIGSGYNAVPPPGLAQAAPAAPTLSSQVIPGMVPPPPSTAAVPQPQVELQPQMSIPAPGGMEDAVPAVQTAVPAVAAVQPGVLQAASAGFNGGIATPPTGMGQSPVVLPGVPGMVDGTFQADQIGPVITGPGATKEQNAFQLCKLTPSQCEMINRAKKYAMEQSIKTVLVKQTIAHQAQQQLNFQTTVQKQQALALMCRIYVGSINFEIKEDTIKQAFQPFGPIKSVNLSWDAVTNKHKGFAFIEYDLPEAASLAMDQMNSVMIGGRNIKVGRPSNMPQAQPIIEQLKEEARTFNRVYVSSIHPDLEESDVKSVFEAFGPVRTCQLVPEPTKPGKHKGYGFLEYENSKSCDDAVASMNLFDLGGQFLRVGRAITPPDVFLGQQPPPAAVALPTASAVAAAAVTAKLTAMEVQAPLTRQQETSRLGSKPAAESPNQQAIPPPGLATALPPVGLALPTAIGTPIAPAAPVAQPQPIPPQAPAVVPPVGLITNLPVPSVEPKNSPAPNSPTKPKDAPADNTIGAQENLQISGRNARHMVMQKLMRESDECKVCVMRNMVGPEDVDDELQHEVEEECSKYGHVVRVIIYQEKQGEEADAETIVKIFVEFTNQQEVEKAAAGLNGRFFGGRVLRAEKYSQDLYQANDLSG